MKKINSLGRALGFLMMLSLIMISCSKSGNVTPPPTPTPTLAPTINWVVNPIDPKIGTKAWWNDQKIVNILTTNDTSRSVVGQNNLPFQTPILENPVTYVATASGRGGTTTSSYTQEVIPEKMSFLCKTGKSWINEYDSTRIVGSNVWTSHTTFAGYIELNPDKTGRTNGGTPWPIGTWDLPDTVHIQLDGITWNFSCDLVSRWVQSRITEDPFNPGVYIEEKKGWKIQ